jgi:hypothetical protein
VTATGSVGVKRTAACAVETETILLEVLHEIQFTKKFELNLTLIHTMAPCFGFVDVGKFSEFFVTFFSVSFKL